MECPLHSANGAELIVSYIAHTLAPEAEAAFAQHLTVCEPCREMAAAQQSVWSALDEWTPAPVSADFDETLFRRIAEEEHSTWWQRLLRANWSWRPAMPVAAGCAVLVAAFLLRTPFTAPQPHAQPKLQIEQVEHALDDLEMLKQLGVTVPADQVPTAEKL